jgi:tetratricopeptide (TPR) repeat protein
MTAETLFQEALARPAEERAAFLAQACVGRPERVLPPDNQDTLATMNNLAPAYLSVNRPAEAVKLLEEVLAARKRTLPPGHPDAVMAMNNLARVYVILGRHAEAQKLFQEMQGGQKPVPPDHAAPAPDAPLQRPLAVQHAWKGDWKAAAAGYARVFAVQPVPDGSLGFEYAAVLLLSGDQEGYRKMCAEMLQLGGWPGVRPYHVARACTLAADSVKDAALPGRMAALELRQSQREFWSLTEQGALAYRAGRYDEAATLLEQSLEADAKPGRAVLNWLWLALVEQRRGKPEKARAWLEKATKWLKQSSRDAPPVEDEATGLDLHNWLEAQVLRREAEALLEPKK